MDIINIVNAMQPNTISCFALNQGDFPNGGTGTPFMGGYVQLFPGATLPSEASVTAYEPTYTAALTALQLAQAAVAAAQSAIASGITITSTGTSALNGTYPLDPATQAKVNGVTTCILVNGTFPNNATTLNWYDISGVSHTFPNVTAFKNFANAFVNYITPIDEYANSGGASGSLPPNQITIP